MSNKKSELHCIVTGRVQGVAYRNFAQTICSDLGVTGFVANLPDGSVEVLAQGDYNVLKVIKNHLEKGPAGAQVRMIYDDWREPSKMFGSFSII